MMANLQSLGVVAFLLLASTAAFGAELDRKPTIRTFASADGTTFLRVTPSEEEPAVASGRVFRRGAEQEEQVLWEAKLVNSPDRAFVSSSGQVATVENWEHAWGDHAVVVYDATGVQKADIKVLYFISYQNSMDWQRELKGVPTTWRNSWTGRCRFAIDDDREEFLVTPPSGRQRRISFVDGRTRFGAPEVELHPPQITLKGISKHDGRRLVYEVLNPNEQPLYYYGYTVDSFSPPIAPGRMYPLCGVEVQRQAGGDWEAINPGHCKTGVGEVFVPARATQRFYVHHDWAGEVHAIRFGIRWHHDNLQDWPLETLWSEPVVLGQRAELPLVDE